MGCVILGQRGSACVEGQVRDLMTKIVDVGGVLGRVTVLLPRPDLGRSSDYRTLLSPLLPPSSCSQRTQSPRRFLLAPLPMFGES